MKETLENIANRIREFLVKNYLPDSEPGSIALDQPLLTGGIIDSVSMLMLINFLEETFGIAFEIHEIDRETFNTVAGIANRVLSKLGECA